MAQPQKPRVKSGAAREPKKPGATTYQQPTRPRHGWGTGRSAQSHPVAHVDPRPLFHGSGVGEVEKTSETATTLTPRGEEKRKNE